VTNESCSNKVFQDLEKVLKRGMIFDFPDLVGYRSIKARRIIKLIITILIIKTIRSTKLLL
jgi:hypothetical protein